MLRITADDKPRVVTYRLEGKLEGPWVQELERCWRDIAADANRPALRVDLTGVTYVDAAGKAQLAEMHRRGAKFIAGDCLTAAIVDEIGGEPPSAAAMSEQLTQLQRLREQLHEVNDALARAARPLERLDDLHGPQRQQVASEIRAGLARWEDVTRQISRVLGDRNDNGLE
jgi:ABC-type transporter Mla MlaB component